MQAGLPVLACTDPNTDVGKVVEDGGFGWWCGSCDTAGVNAAVLAACSADTNDMGTRAWIVLNEQYNVSGVYETIVNGLKQ